MTSICDSDDICIVSIIRRRSTWHCKHVVSLSHTSIPRTVQAVVRRPVAVAAVLLSLWKVTRVNPYRWTCWTRERHSGMPSGE